MTRLFLIVTFLSASFYSQAQSGKGSLVYRHFIAPSILGNPGGEDAMRGLTIYLPPDYQKSRSRYPVVYLLHGFNGEDSTTMSDLHINRLADRAIAKFRIKPFILVLPNSNTRFGGSFYTNSALTGNWADYIARDVVRYIDREFRTIRSRDARGICGISMGGNGALKIAMLFPQIFGCVYAMTPAVLNWSDGNNIRLNTFRELDTLKTEAAVFADFRRTLYIDLGRSYSPDLQKPPFYAAMPAHYQGDSLIINEAVVRQWESNFPTVMIESHIAALKSMRAIKLEWGRDDQ